LLKNPPFRHRERSHALAGRSLAISLPCLQTIFRLPRRYSAKAEFLLAMTFSTAPYANHDMIFQGLSCSKFEQSLFLLLTHSVWLGTMASALRNNPLEYYEMIA